MIFEISITPEQLRAVVEDSNKELPLQSATALFLTNVQVMAFDQAEEAREEITQVLAAIGKRPMEHTIFPKEGTDAK
jgi:hypothetical protein